MDAILRGQLGVPILDISNVGAWEDVTFGDNDAILFDELDEVIPDNETSAIRKAGTPVQADTFEVRLTSLTDPAVSFGHQMRMIARGPSTKRVKMQLFEGAILRAESGFFTLSSTFQTFVYNLTTVEIDSITDYANLRVRVVPDVV